MNNPNIQVLKASESGIFTNYIYKAIPLAFDESMSYYECLCGLLNYLKNVVIPTLNNNADAVIELQQLYEELHDYVEHYFDNLDVQEEINNKLDEMAESGELSDIIAQYLGLAGMITFDTVADMKLAENLVNGSKCATLGYHNVNDKGNAFYKIRYITNDDTVDESTIIALYDNQLIAELIIENTMNVKQFGAYGDETNDDTDKIQNALNKCNNVNVPDGTYMIDAVTKHINLKNNNKLILSNNAILKAITNNAERYVICNIENVNNVEISGGTILGERTTHTGGTGEWGSCIKIHGTSNSIYIHDTKLKDAWGDGITIDTSGNVQTERLHIDNARRNGISIICANNYISDNDYIENTNGTNPQFAIDIEPDNDDEILNNITINNLTTYNNTGGGISQHYVRENSNKYYIEINNYKSINDYRGLWVYTDGNSIGNININYPTIKNSKQYGIYVKKIGKNIGCNIVNPLIDGYFSTATGASTGLMITTDANTTSGNLNVIKPTIINNLSTNTNIYSIRFDQLTNCTYEDIKIIDPLLLDHGIQFNSLSNNLQIIDSYNINKGGQDGAYTVNGNGLPSLVTTDMTTQLRQFWISNATKFPIGYRIKFLNNGSYGIKLYFQDQYIYGISNELSKITQSTDNGAYLEIERISSNAWTVISKSGTWS